MQQEIDKQIKVLRDADIIEEAMTPWQAPVVMVKKQHTAPGESPWRLTVDYRKVNSVTKPMSFVMPRVDEACDAIGAIAGSCNNELFMSVLDMRSGYYSISLDEESKPKTGFVTQRAVYQFKRLSMGLVNAPMSYQMIMQDVLRNLHWKCALAYIDDVLVYSVNFQTHLQDLRDVFQRIRVAKLRIHSKKGQFAASQVRYVGHILARDGVKIDPEKTRVISQIPTPKSAHDVRVFLGCTNFFRKYIYHYSQIAAPLNQLLRKEIEFNWTDDCEKAFVSLKQALLSAPVLRYPDFNKSYVLTCDASDKAIGYWLGQADNKNQLYAIAYEGRSLSPREQRYSVSERECLALVEGIKQFRIYLATGQFKVITDHFSLQYLRSIRDMNGRLGRWSLFLQGYSFTIEFKAGRLNTAADSLSRFNYADIKRNEEQQSVQEHVQCELYYAEHTPCIAVGLADNKSNCDDSVGLADTIINTNDIKKQQVLDIEIKAIIDYVEKASLPEDQQAARKIVIESADYVSDHGILYHLYYPRGKGSMLDRQIKQLVIPESLKSDVLTSFHDSPIAAHQGADRMYAAMRQRYHWRTMYKDTQAYARSCIKCQESNADLHKRKAPLKPLPIGEPWSRIHVDVCGPFTKSEPDGYVYLLVITCAFSKWVEAFCLKTQTAAEIAWLLYAEIFCRYGAARTLLSDRGAVFMSELITELYRLFTVTKTQTSSYHPECNAAAERNIGSIVGALR